MAKNRMEPKIAIEGKQALVTIVSMIVGLLDTFGGQVREDAAAYEIRSPVDHD